METGKSPVSIEQVINLGWSIVVHKEVLVVTIRGKEIKVETSSYSSFTESFEELRDWLKETKVTNVRVECTGVYWERYLSFWRMRRKLKNQ